MSGKFKLYRPWNTEAGIFACFLIIEVIWCSSPCYMDLCNLHWYGKRNMLPISLSPDFWHTDRHSSLRKKLCSIINSNVQIWFHMKKCLNYFLDIFCRYRCKEMLTTQWFSVKLCILRRICILGHSQASHMLKYTLNVYLR